MTRAESFESAYIWSNWSSARSRYSEALWCWISIIATSLHSCVYGALMIGRVRVFSTTGWSSRTQSQT